MYAETSHIELQTTPAVVWVNELELAPAATSAAQARQFVERFCDHLALPYLVDDMSLVVSELVTNAVVHARTRIRVRLEEVPFCVMLTVYDDAVDVPFVAIAARALAEDESGRGLWLVDACSADWGTRLGTDDGKSTWVLFAVRPKSSWADRARTEVALTDS